MRLERLKAKNLLSACADSPGRIACIEDLPGVFDDPIVVDASMVCCDDNTIRFQERFHRQGFAPEDVTPDGKFRYVRIVVSHLRPPPSKNLHDPECGGVTIVCDVPLESNSQEQNAWSR